MDGWKCCIYCSWTWAILSPTPNAVTELRLCCHVTLWWPSFNFVKMSCPTVSLLHSLCRRGEAHYSGCRLDECSHCCRLHSGSIQACHQVGVYTQPWLTPVLYAGKSESCLNVSACEKWSKLFSILWFLGNGLTEFSNTSVLQKCWIFYRIWAHRLLIFTTKVIMTPQHWFIHFI